jgi:hypothetical protein
MEGVVMKSDYFRWYPSEWRNDISLQACSLAARGLWVEMLNIMWAAPIRGTLTIGPDVEHAKQIECSELARLVGTDEQSCLAALDELESHGIFGRLPDSTIYSRQMYSSKTASNGSVTEHVATWRRDVQSTWNIMADKHKLPRLEAWTEPRIKALRQRVAERYWRDNWRIAMDRIAEDKWYLGENERGWKATPDWFLRPGTVAKIIERTATKRPQQSSIVDMELVERYKGQ